MVRKLILLLILIQFSCTRKEIDCPKPAIGPALKLLSGLEYDFYVHYGPQDQLRAHFVNGRLDSVMDGLVIYDSMDRIIQLDIIMTYFHSQYGHLNYNVYNGFFGIDSIIPTSLNSPYKHLFFYSSNGKLDSIYHVPNLLNLGGHIYFFNFQYQSNENISRFEFGRFKKQTIGFSKEVYKVFDTIRTDNNKNPQTSIPIPILDLLNTYPGIGVLYNTFTGLFPNPGPNNIIFLGNKANLNPSDPDYFTIDLSYTYDSLGYPIHLISTQNFNTGIHQMRGVNFFYQDSGFPK